MTLYVKRIVIPANTSKEQSIEEEIEIEEDVITRVEIYFPPGHFLLTKVALFYGSYQFFPHYKYDWAMGNDETIVDEPYFILPASPSRITVKAYNEDTQYDHQIVVRIMAVPYDQAFWWLELKRIRAYSEATANILSQRLIAYRVM